MFFLNKLPQFEKKNRTNIVLYMYIKLCLSKCIQYKNNCILQVNIIENTGRRHLSKFK